MKRITKLFFACALTVPMLGGVAYADTWQQDETGWWCQNDNGGYYADGWHWIDANGDGVSECYYFDSDGYLLTDTTTPDGYQVSADGAWTVNGILQRKSSGPSSGSAVSQADALAIYQAAQERANTLDSLTARLDGAMGINMTVDGNTMSLPMTMSGTVQMKGVTSGNLSFLSTITVNFMGTDSTSTGFYTNGVYYMDTDGSKLSMAMPLENMINQAKNVLPSDSISADSFTYLQADSLSDGGWQLTYIMDTGSMLDQVKRVYETLGLSTDGLYQDNLNISQLEGTSVINSDGYPVSSEVRVSMDVSENGASSAIGVYMHYTYENPGQPADFVLPSTEGYVSIS